MLIHAIVTCVLTLLLSIYPGLLEYTLGFPSIALLLLRFTLTVGIGIALVAIVVEREVRLAKNSLAKIGLILVIVISSYALVNFYVPRRIAFLVSRPAFERWLAQNRPKNSTAGSLNTKLGIYHVERYATDARGGGLTIDPISYGFAYQPNPEGSPFGSIYYEIYPLGNGWFWFDAS